MIKGDSLVQIDIIYQFVIYVVLNSRKDSRWQNERSKSIIKNKHGSKSCFSPAVFFTNDIYVNRVI